MNIRIVNPANLFLAVLLALTLLQALFQVSLTSTKNVVVQSIGFTVLERNRDSFGQLRYYVWYDLAMWQLTSPTTLRLGHQYFARSQIQAYSFLWNQPSTFDHYELGLGIRGKIKVIELSEQILSCNPGCQGLGMVEKSRKYVRDTYQKAYCTNFTWVLEFLVQKNCQDVFGLSVGLVLGGTQDFSPEIKDKFRLLGLSHLVAVSGFQVVLIVQTLESLTAALGFSRKKRLLLYAIGIVALILLVGPQPPVLRSSVSVLLSSLVLFVFGRRISSMRALLYSGIILLWINPFYIISASFQLSFAASLGLICGVQISSQIHPSWLKSSLELLFSTINTFAFTLPLVVNLGGYVSLFGILANLIIIPIISLLTFINIAGLMPIIGDVPLLVASVIQSLVIFLVEDLSQYAPVWKMSKFSLLEIIIYKIILISICTVVTNKVQYIGTWKDKIQSIETQSQLNNKKNSPIVGEHDTSRN